MNRRIRFGLVFLGPSPTSDGQFLRDLGIKNIEGCSVKSKHYVLFTLDKAKKSNDIIRAVEEQNRVNNGGDNASDLEIELLMASDGVLSDGASTMVLLPVDERIVHMGDESAPSVSGDSVKGSRHSKKNSTLVAVFDKGHAFQSHEIFRMINMAKLSHLHMQPPPVVGEFNIPASENQPSGYWSWTSPASSGAAPDPSVRKRAISELTSNLVEGSIKPSAQKRMSPAPKDAGSDIESEVFGSNDGGGSRQQTMVDNVSEAEGAPTAPMNEGDVSAEDQDGSLSTSLDHPTATVQTPSSSSRRQTTAATRRRSGAATAGANKQLSRGPSSRGGSQASSSVPANAMLIMRELIEAQEETIGAKNQLIQLLMMSRQ